MTDTSNVLKVVFAGGGTGGHLYPAIAIAEEINRRHPDVEIHFVGTKQGLEARVIPTLGYQFHLNAIRGLRRKLAFENVLLPFRIVWSLFQCIHLLGKVEPHVVVGTGGYVSGPTLFIAAILGIPTVIQEQNSYPGATTRLLAYMVDRVHLSFTESGKYFRSKKKLRISGNPVRTLVSGVSKSEARKRLGLDPNRDTLLIFGGSQGAHAINQIMIEAMPQILEKTFAQVIWGTGKLDYEKVATSVQALGKRVKVLEYIDEMQLAYSASDCAICRSGASTLAEITLSGLPSILIPYPFATARHQEVNARSLESLGAAVVVIQKDLQANVLANLVIEFLNNTRKRNKMEQAAKAASHPQAAKDIVDSIFEII